ncbi:MAG: cell shape-determining protein RodA [Francisellaceae bacterium]|nr:cell shape-determining protein RodA [Francisellaceae bacterium]
MSNFQKPWWAKLHLDLPLLMGILGLATLSFIILYSAKEDIHFIQKQFIRLGLAFILMFLVAQLPPRFYKSFSIWLYLSSLLLLIAVLIIGDISKGAQRWLNFGFVRFQPAEFMKLALPIMLSQYLENQILPPTLKTLLFPILFILAPVLLVAFQPDLGTAILIMSTGLLVIFFSGISWRYILTSMTLASLATPLMWYCLRDYQRHRILTLLNPENDPLGRGYHIIQSKIAIGSGGLYGKGWLKGTQSHLEYLPERSTDFIFAVLGEEFGFIGICILLMLYLYIIIRGLNIGIQAQDTFSRLLAGSLTLTFFVYVFVNIAMVTGLLPVVGIPLPLVSYGGTSMVTLMVSFGMLMSIQTHRSLLHR